MSLVGLIQSITVGPNQCIIATAASYSLTSDGIASSTSSRENSGSDTGQFRGREENTMPQECLGNF